MISTRKLDRAFAANGLANMTATQAHILRNLGDLAALDGLTTAQLTVVIGIANRSFHDGKQSCNAEVIDGDAAWIGAGVNRLVPLAALRAMTIQESHEVVPRTPSRQFPAATECWSTKRYMLDYTERV